MSDTINAQDQLLATKIAEMTIIGANDTKQMATILSDMGVSLTRRQYNKLKKSETYKSVMAEATDTIRKNAVAELVRKTSELVPLIDTALRKALEEGNVQAVPHALKILGLDGKQDDKPQQAQQLVVMLPGAKTEKDVT